MKIGVIVGLLRKPLLEGIDFAAELGVDGVQISVRPGDSDYNLVACGEAELAAIRRRCEANRIVISALCGDLGGSFQAARECMDRVELMKQVVDRAQSLGVKVITTHIGCIPDDRRDPVYAIMLLSVRAAAEYAARRGVVFAVETGPEKADVLKAFLEEVGSAGLGVNLDPANLRMVSCEDPVYAVGVLAPYIVHTHAKDGVNLYPGSAAKAYGMRNADGSRRELLGRAAEYREVPLGQGQVPWDDYLAALRQAGFDGFLTIERECGEDPVRDIGLAVGFLKRKIGAR